MDQIPVFIIRFIVRKMPEKEDYVDNGMTKGV